VTIVAAYGLAHLLLRVGLSPIVTIDDSREAVLAQTLEWGYLSRQPPLYNWLVWIAYQLFGQGVAGLTVVKYAVLGAAYLFVYLSARRILRQPPLAALAALSLWLIVPINWVVHEALTHSLSALAAAAAMYYVLLRLEATGSVWAYLGLGLTLGLGLLSKFSFGLFAGAMLLGALTVEPFRARLRDPRIGLTLAVAALLLLPYGVWFYRHAFSITRIYAEEVDPGDPEPYLRGLASAVYYMVRVSLYYLTPLWIVFLALFPAAWRRGGAPAAPPAGYRLIERFFLAQLGILLAGALFAGLTYLKFRWLLPSFFLFPLYFLARVDGRADAARVRRLGVVLVAAELLVLAAFVVNVVRGDRLGNASHLNVPYDRIAAQLRAAGFTRGTIAAGEGPLAGNLRLAFPTSRVIRLANPDYLPAPRGSGQCLIAWDKERDETVPGEMRAWLAAALGVTLGADPPVRLAEARFHYSRRQTLRVRYVLLPEGAGHCR
jgi:4-amino-4-deoxy-L-arabinose transferase-like glycosyltransferase